MVLLDLTTPSDVRETLSRGKFSAAVLCRLNNRSEPSDLELSEINRLLGWAVAGKAAKHKRRTKERRRDSADL